MKPLIPAKDEEDGVEERRWWWPRHRRYQPIDDRGTWNTTDASTACERASKSGGPATCETI